MTNQGSVGKKLRNEWLSWREDGSRRALQIGRQARGMRIREKTRQESARIEDVRSTLHPYRVTKIEIKDENGQWVGKTTQSEVFQGFLFEAFNRGSQTSNTQFITQPLRGEFGFSANSLAVEEVLVEAYSPPTGTDPYILKVLPHLKIPDTVSESVVIKSDIVKDEYARSWSRMREFTGTGPSGLHFGYLKVMHLSPLKTDIFQVWPKFHIRPALVR